MPGENKYETVAPLMFNAGEGHWKPHKHDEFRRFFKEPCIIMSCRVDEKYGVAALVVATKQYADRDPETMNDEEAWAVPNVLVALYKSMKGIITHELLTGILGQSDDPPMPFGSAPN